MSGTVNPAIAALFARAGGGAPGGAIPGAALGMMPGAPGGPFVGSAPATAPTPNMGLVRQGMNKAMVALKALEESLPMVGTSGALGKAKADSQFATDMQGITQTAENMPTDMQCQFRNIVNNYLAPRLGATGVMTGEQFKQVESELSNLARGYRGTGDPDKRMLGDALMDVTHAMRDALERSNPGKKKDLEAVNSAYAMLSRVFRWFGRTAAEYLCRPIWSGRYDRRPSVRGSGRRSRVVARHCKSLPKVGKKCCRRRFPTAARRSAAQ
jgi:hypothetical protein